MMDTWQCEERNAVSGIGGQWTMNIWQGCSSFCHRPFPLYSLVSSLRFVCYILSVGHSGNLSLLILCSSTTFIRIFHCSSWYPFSVSSVPSSPLFIMISSLLLILCSPTPFIHLFHCSS